MNKAQAAQRIYLLQQNIKALESEVATLKQQHFGNLEIDNYTEGDFLVSVQRNARFDPGLAMSVLSETEYDAILVERPDSAKAKDILAPARFRQCQKESTPKVVISLLPDEDD